MVDGVGNRWALFRLGGVLGGEEKVRGICGVNEELKVTKGLVLVWRWDLERVDRRLSLFGLMRRGRGKLRNGSEGVDFWERRRL